MRRITIGWSVSERVGSMSHETSNAATHPDQPSMQSLESSESLTRSSQSDRSEQSEQSDQSAAKGSGDSQGGDGSTQKQTGRASLTSNRSNQSNQSNHLRPVVLCVLDGWGHREEQHGNAVFLAQPAHFENLRRHPTARLLRTDGRFVGLPEGLFGNSEVGHLHLGLGRVERQSMVQLNEIFADTKRLLIETSLQDHLQRVAQRGGRVHLVGLLSAGGVHSHRTHMAAMGRVVLDAGIACVLHAIADGRDEPGGRTMGHIAWWQSQLPNIPVVTLIGRYYAMDRNNNHALVTGALRAMIDRTAQRTYGSLNELQGIVETQLTQGSEEFLEATVAVDVAPLDRERDLVIHMNFRPDRARQLIHALEERGVDLVSMYRFSGEQKSAHLFTRDSTDQSVGEVIARHGLRQFRIAETEKYAHVTYFFSAYREEPWPGESRVLIPSPSVKTFDEQPKMAAHIITDTLLQAITARAADFYLVNYANPDMVGHTGSLPAAIEAVKWVDVQLGRLLETCKKMGARLVVLADHGNADQMITDEGQPHTYHTMSPVWAIGLGFKPFQPSSDRAITPPTKGDPRKHDATNDLFSAASHAAVYEESLIDVGPTILQSLNLPIPAQMTGRPLWTVET